MKAERNETNNEFFSSIRDLLISLPGESTTLWHLYDWDNFGIDVPEEWYFQMEDLTRSQRRSVRAAVQSAIKRTDPRITLNQVFCDPQINYQILQSTNRFAKALFEPIGDEE